MVNTHVAIAVDAMSGDFGPEAIVPAALSSLARHPHLSLVLAGDEPTLKRVLKANRARVSSRLAIVHTTEVVGMDESPTKVLRNKKDSSMRVAVNIVRDGGAQACVSAGNTGALMATSRFVLKTLSGIDRPAIISPIPALQGQTLMLDLGANTECSPEQLFQFAVMGSVLADTVYNVDKPRVALLNIGEEEIKGNQNTRDADSLLAAEPELNYVGYVEGDGIYVGEVDVVVCDGFCGNVALKTSEGLGKLIAQYLREEFTRNPLRRVVACLAWPVLRSFRQRVDPRHYNGASFVGLQGTVIKSHGNADPIAFESAIETAVLEAERGVPQRIHDRLAETLSQQ